MPEAVRFLRNLDSLSYPDRSRLLADTGRALVGTAELDVLLDDLHPMGSYERGVALTIASAAGHADYVHRCLDAPDTTVAARALAAAIRLGAPPHVLTQRLPALPLAFRRTVYAAARRYGALALADALLPVALGQFGEHEAAAVLPACSASVLARELPALAFAVTSWTSIGHRHPAVLFGYLEAELASSPHSAWPDLLARLGAGLAAAAPADPGRALALLERSARYAAIPGPVSRVIGTLARHDPARVLGILLTPGRPGGTPERRSLWRALMGAADADLARLGRIVSRARLPAFFHVIPPSRRAAVYAGLLDRRDLIGPGIPLEVIDELPAQARAAQARLMLSVRGFADDPDVRLAVTARLPWPEAEPDLRTATRRAIAPERAAAYPLYVQAAAATRDSAVVTEMVTSLTRLTNEQDPVRASALAALAKVAPWLFAPAVVPALDTLMSDAVQARDCSWPTQQDLRVLADRLIRHGAVSGQPDLVDAGLDATEKLGGYLGRLNLYGLDRSLPRGAEHRVFLALRPRIEAEARRGRYATALALAHGLRRRAWAMPELQEVLDQARRAEDDSVVRDAIDLWLRPAATRDQRVEQVLAGDRSTITVPAVAQTVSRRRTDLLDDVFGRPMHGRFLKPGVRYLPPFGRHVEHWLPRQVAVYASLLADLATAPGVPVHERAAAVGRLGRLPGSTELVRPFLADRELPVVEAALAALAWADNPARVLPDLLAYAGTDRARVAVYAATRCARFVPPQQLVDPLSRLLTGQKVTARKEAVRLISEHHVPGSVTLLSDAWAAPRQHRDVRRAIVSASRRLLDDERAWTLLGSAARDVDVAPALLEVPVEAISERHRARYTALIRIVAFSPDPDTARHGLAILPRWIRWDNGESTAPLIAGITDVRRTATWRAALNALVSSCAAAEAGAPLLEVVRRLLAARADDAAERFAAAPDRDQPARQRLTALADAIIAAASRVPALRAVLGDAAELIAGQPACQDVAVRLAACAVPWDIEGADLRQLRRLLAAIDRPARAAEAARILQASLSPVISVLPPDRAVALTQALAGDGSPAAASLAAAIAGVAGHEAGWNPTWRSVIRGLRQHPDIDVQIAAASVVTTLE